MQEFELVGIGEEIETPDNRKIYQKPQITHELELEVHAGSPLNIDPLDPFSEGP